MVNVHDRDTKSGVCAEMNLLTLTLVFGDA